MEERNIQRAIRERRGFPEPAVQKGHGARKHTAPRDRKPTALDEVESLAQRLDEAGELEEVVAVVGIAHEDVADTGSLDAPHVVARLCKEADIPD